MELYREIPTSTCTLKVNLKCCKECEEKAMQKLKKIHEVDSVTYNTKRGLLRVSGNIDPMILIQEFAKWGRKAELYYFQKESMEIDQDECNGSSCRNKVQDDAKADGLASSDQSTKGVMKVFVSWFSKKEKKAKTTNTTGSKNGLLVKSPAAAKWHFPNTPMMGPFGTFDHNATMMLPRPGTVPPRYGYRPIPPPHPYGGGYQSMPRAPPMVNSMIMDGGYRWMPRAPPMVNPMIHYSSYDDNNFHYP